MQYTLLKALKYYATNTAKIDNLPLTGLLALLAIAITAYRINGLKAASLFRRKKRNLP